MINRTISLKDEIKGELKCQEDLSKHTTMNVGGTTPVWLEPKDKKDLVKILDYARNKEDEIFIMGEGSNVIIGGGELDYLFIKLSQTYFRKVEYDSNIIKVGAGTRLKKLIRSSLKRNLTGLEYFTLVPSTVGGAVMSNLTTYIGGKEYKFLNLVNKIKLLNRKDLKEESIIVKGNDLFLKDKVILGIELKLKKGKGKKIMHRKEKIEKYRKNTQDYKYPSCGCIFRNPEGKSAAKLIDSTGLKGKKVGGAKVSLKHANFIVNYDRATSSDVLNLINLIQKEVFQKSKIWLEPEVEILA